VKSFKARTLTAVLAIIGATSLAAPSAHTATQENSLGLTSAEATDLQNRVDDVLELFPGGRQTSATTVEFDGMTATVDPHYKETPGEVSTTALNCSYGWLCMEVRGTEFAFYTCKYWSVSNWWGDGPFINNQTPGTVARFYNQDGSVRWTSTAYQSGTATWDPIWGVRPC
jgi:hypothetical protein